MAAKSLCKIEDCGRLATRRGLCGRHYQKWYNHGDPLGGRSYPDRGEALKYYRDVVLAYEGDECLQWPFGRSNGYGTISLGGRSQLVHRRVCEDVNGPPPTPKHEAAHSCGKGYEGCCAKRHLTWKTHADNVADTIIHGTRNRGERHGSAKLTRADVLAIRELRGRLLQREIADQFGISATCVSQIHRREIWGWL